MSLLWRNLHEIFIEFLFSRHPVILFMPSTKYFLVFLFVTIFHHYRHESSNLLLLSHPVKYRWQEYGFSNFIEVGNIFRWKIQSCHCFFICRLTSFQKNVCSYNGSTQYQCNPR